jgi:hypothetical protein
VEEIAVGAQLHDDADVALPLEDLEDPYHSCVGQLLEDEHFDDHFVHLAQFLESGGLQGLHGEDCLGVGATDAEDFSVGALVYLALGSVVLVREDLVYQDDFIFGLR